MASSSVSLKDAFSTIRLLGPISLLLKSGGTLLPFAGMDRQGVSAKSSSGLSFLTRFLCVAGLAMGCTVLLPLCFARGREDRKGLGQLSELGRGVAIVILVVLHSNGDALFFCRQLGEGVLILCTFVGMEEMTMA